MICIVGTRGTGKTTRLLELSAQSGIPIAVRDVIHATWLRRYMSQCGIDAPDPIVVGRGIYGERGFTSIEVKRDSDGMVPVLIDDVRAFFGDMGIRAACASGATVRKAARNDFIRQTRRRSDRPGWFCGLHLRNGRKH